MILTRLLGAFLCLGLIITPVQEPFADDGHGHGEEHGDRSEHDDDHEEKVTISEETLERKGVKLERAGPHDISRTLFVNAKVSASRDKLAHLHPRFSGLITEVRKHVGDKVARGEVVAVIESNQSLQRYQVTSLIDGTVIYRHATLGEFVDETRPILVVADLSTVWVDLHVFPRDFASIRLGQTVLITAPHAPNRAFTSKITFISGVVDEASQARVARVVIDNHGGELLPDQYVNGEVLLETFRAEVAVRTSALQRSGNITGVFVRDGPSFLQRAVVVGRSDSEYTEVLSGLKPGDEYAKGNTFILKADLEKASVAHEH